MTWQNAVHINEVDNNELIYSHLAWAWLVSYKKTRHDDWKAGDFAVSKVNHYVFGDENKEQMLNVAMCFNYGDGALMDEKFIVDCW